MIRAPALLAAVIFALLGGVGCGSTQANAAKDPMRCERDPACGKARGSYPDCTRQCSDDQECERRCEEVQHGTDALGHP
jgi:hypothetical protein